MNKEIDLKKRTQAFALRVIRLCESLGPTTTEKVIAKQLLRCGTAVGANYRAACRSRSTAEFVAKLGVVEEECDESQYWMELLIEAKFMESVRLDPLMNEAEELLSIIIASIKTARKNNV